MMNLREKEDGWAAAFGGFISGAILGLPRTYLAPLSKTWRWSVVGCARLQREETAADDSG